MTAAVLPASKPVPATRVPAPVVLLFHCPVDLTEWNGIDGAGCWFCGGSGVQGRVPAADGRSAPGWKGHHEWKASEDEVPRV